MDAKQFELINQLIEMIEADKHIVNNYFSTYSSLGGRKGLWEKIKGNLESKLVRKTDRDLPGMIDENYKLLYELIGIKKGSKSRVGEACETVGKKHGLDDRSIRSVQHHTEHLIFKQLWECIQHGEPCKVTFREGILRTLTPLGPVYRAIEVRNPDFLQEIFDELLEMDELKNFRKKVEELKKLREEILKKLRGGGTDPDRVFICHSDKDKDLVDDLEAKIKAAKPHIEVVKAPHSLEEGKPDSIKETLHHLSTSSKVILLLTDNWLSSAFAIQESGIAYYLSYTSGENVPKLLPLCFVKRADTGLLANAVIHEKNIADFDKEVDELIKKL